MPFYNDLRPNADFNERDFERVDVNMTPEVKIRCAEGVLRLKAQLEDLSARKTERNLLVASWNIVALGAGDYREGEALYYLAEILSHFDLVAIQEQRADLSDLNKICRILGPNWQYIVTDPMGGKKGNDERSTLLFNTHRVVPSGLSGELQMWQELVELNPDGLERFPRPPHITGFRAGWKEFAVVNLHLHPGKKSERGDRPSDADIRRSEVEGILSILADRKDKLWTPNLILAGDMNFYKEDDDATIMAITDLGYIECEGLKGKTTNITVDSSDREAYDRLFFSDETYFDLATVDGAQQGGVINPFLSVFRDGDVGTYTELMAEKHGTPAKGEELKSDAAKAWKYYRDTFRKRQLADHFPIWVELEIDSSAAFLEGKIEEVADADLTDAD